MAPTIRSAATQHHPATTGQSRCPVAASCVIPAYFTPIRIDGVDYLDGGVHSPTNADLLQSLVK
jgi:predicted acylesterase/phospholipase RssA